MTEPVLRTDDIVAINQLVSAYAHAVDDGDGDGFAALFTEDAVLEMGPTIVEGGPAALAAFAASVPDRVPGIRHVMSTVSVRPSGPGTALALVYLETFRRVGEGPALSLTQFGRYRFELAAGGPAGWAIRRVSISPQPVE